MGMFKGPVLIVEDEYDSIQMVSKILNYSGTQVHIAHNGCECLDILEQIEPTLVIMDLAMPELDGWNTLVQMRANPRTAHIPVVALTAYHSSNLAVDAVQAGFDAYFAKPINPKTFVPDLVRILEPAA